MLKETSSYIDRVGKVKAFISNERVISSKKSMLFNVSKAATASLT